MLYCFQLIAQETQYFWVSLRCPSISDMSFWLIIRWACRLSIAQNLSQKKSCAIENSPTEPPSTSAHRIWLRQRWKSRLQWFTVYRSNPQWGIWQFSPLWPRWWFLRYSHTTLSRIHNRIHAAMFSLAAHSNLSLSKHWRRLRSNSWDDPFAQNPHLSIPLKLIHVGTWWTFFLALLKKYIYIYLKEYFFL